MVEPRARKKENYAYAFQVRTYDHVPIIGDG